VKGDRARVIFYVFVFCFGCVSVMLINSTFSSDPLTPIVVGNIRSTLRRYIPHNSIILHYEKLYRKYKDELLTTLYAVKELCAQPETTCLSNQIELEITYLRIRDMEPDVVWEISPNHGYSTFWILYALMHNGHGHLYSFDVLTQSIGNVPDFLGVGRWNMTVGDVTRTLLNKNMFNKYPSPSYLFLDCLHSYQFGRTIMTELFAPLLARENNRSIGVSYHDVFNPQFWADGRASRDFKLYPEWMPNEEGIVVLEWLAFRDVQEACRMYTLAKSLSEYFLNQFLAMRLEIVGDERVWSNTPLDQTNPMLYFELACTS